MACDPVIVSESSVSADQVIKKVTEREKGVCKYEIHTEGETWSWPKIKEVNSKLCINT